MIPAPRELSRCNICNRPVLWTVTRAGNRMAVDAKPHDDGNQACYRISPRTWQSRSLDAADALPLAAWEHRYKPHVATCPGPPKPKPPEPLPPNVVPIRRTR
ncbi:hypothetical protein [Microtetraspora glauca]|uniref:Uncharacterized protein n=1 Tax=Microtetraspora glauca TaxID=1996 RepID=A0ABV3GA72_MICGL